jgi:hypothetical protein
MELSQFSKEEILEELKRREETESSNNHFLCIGLLDDEGLESFIKIKNANHFSELYNSLALRARFNSHRNTKIYSIKIDNAIHDMLIENIQNGKYHESCETIKNLSTFKELNF